MVRLLSWAALLAAAALLPFAADLAGQGYYVGFATRILVFAIAAMALDLVLGYGGLVSLGHAAYLGIGAYAVGIWTSHGVTAAPVHWATAIAAGGLFALLTGLVALRTAGVAFIMITLAFAQMLFFLAVSLKGYGGDDGLTLWDTARLGPLDLGDDRTLYWVALAWLVLLLLLGRRLVGARFGLVLLGARANERRMRAMGLEVGRHRLLAYVLSGMATSIAGCLLAHTTDFVSPAYMNWQVSGELVVMVILGGIGTLYGAIVGAAALLLLEELLAGLTQHWRLILGAILIAMAILPRRGLATLLAAIRGRS
ncbi:amino acid/amide ABC transporter membrane protein 2 (HAAT family) [Stella humosa]|uniref:Amino acid/amide ABC transporter membrane protein 2 (HAAT family) n=1 Tax=Stella humosa TaxID=94 RepID=A0A3N1MEI6_9PROT|nr:branched-chain amino acid ABC transporter permease [Stella humosa]ROQ01545.1 amino acid/amide ABC transporter membrane protein 2 (HAAT family) [Stella humosa]BBK31925.1 branched-chain amino acid ABC transporter permease [Stella humosa]